MLLAGVLCACAGAGKQQRSEPQPVRRVASEATTPSQEGPAPRAAVIVEGTGHLTGVPALPRTSPAPAGEGYQLTFVDTEIASVVASVVGDGLGLPYAVDPQVKGTMTLQAAQPLKREDVLPALEAALSMYGVALINANGIYQAVPMKDAPRRVSGLRGPGQRVGAGFAIELVPIRYVGVADLEKVLRPFAPEGGILRVDEGRNLLLLAGTSRELATLREVINTFDVNWLEGMSFALFPVEYVDAKTLADELGVIFSEAKSPIASVIRLVPLARLNSLMVITHEPTYLKEVEAWIKRLDIGAASPGRRIYVYDVQNGKAEDLALSLSKILSLSIEATDAGRSANRGSVFNRAGSTNAPINGAEAGPVASSGAGSSGASGTLKIVASEENNALLIYATPSEFSLIESALKKLDSEPMQVLIEASLAEVSLNDDLRYGLQWAYQSSTGPVVLSEAANGAINPQFPGFSYLYTGRTDIRAVLNALETITNVNVISSPKLLVLNNREAELQIGDQVPIVVQSAVSTAGESAPIVNAVQLRDTGVILRITPRVNKNGLVLLDIAQEISDVVPTTTSNIDSPTIQQRRISSTVAVRTGETIALGGLIRDSHSRSREGLPYLSRIPLLGELFGSNNKNNRRTELIVLITPRVIRSQEESDEMMDQLREELRGLDKIVPQWRTQKAAGKAGSNTEGSRDDIAPDTPPAAAH
jgi:general secretion pathway protein D